MQSRGGRRAGRCRPLQLWVGPMTWGRKQVTLAASRIVRGGLGLRPALPTCVCSDRLTAAPPTLWPALRVSGQAGAEMAATPVEEGVLN